MSFPKVLLSSFGHITFEPEGEYKPRREFSHDVLVTPKGKIVKRKKKLSKKEGQEGHTPLSVDEIDHYLEKYNPSLLIIGTGQSGILPVSDECIQHLKAKKIMYNLSKTPEAIERYNSLLSDVEDKRLLAIFHITC